jgi:hypothetical protein
VTANHYARFAALQRCAFKHFSGVPCMSDLALAAVAQADTRAALLKHFAPLTATQLRRLCVLLKLVSDDDDGSDDDSDSDDEEMKSNGNGGGGGGGGARLHETRGFLTAVLVEHHCLRRSQRQAARALPLVRLRVLL